MITVVGGVSANSLLRLKLKNFCKEKNVLYIIPKIEYCTDNAAMIARLAMQKLI